MQTLSQEHIQKDHEVKQAVLRKLFGGFQDGMEKINKEQQTLLSKIVEVKQDNV
jgi:hypothetical protein